MGTEIFNHLTERERVKLGRDVLHIFVEESKGLLGPAGAYYELEGFAARADFAPFESYKGIVFVWGRLETEQGFRIIGIPMLESWAADFNVDDVRAAASQVRSNWDKVQASKGAMKDQYKNSYNLLQIHTLQDTFPQFEALPDIPHCKLCADQGKSSAATKLMPISPDKGVTVSLIGSCDSHANEWWKDADWDGQHLVWTRAVA